MVALAQWIEEKEPGVVAENRVWSFLGDTPGSVRQTAVQVTECDWEKGVRLYDWRRAPSLAQREEIRYVPEDPDVFAEKILEIFSLALLAIQI